ncbi:MAG: ACT domain-containing protein [Spirochaetota bacterium]|nr:MAG: ACT domain-containing protein [Spirochaetota bacterium]
MLSLILLPDRYEVCRLDKDESIPASLLNKADFISVTRTAEELSIVCTENTVSDCTKVQKGMRAFKIEGPLSFTLTGVLASLINPLSEQGISVFAISTYDTDYLLVQEEDLLSAIDVLQGVCTIKEG